MKRAPAKVMKENPTADPNSFQVFKLREVERPPTPLPPLSGDITGDLKPYLYETKARKGKKLKMKTQRQGSKASPVPAGDHDSPVETDASEPLTPMSDLGPANPASLPTYSGPSHHPDSLPPYEDLELYDNASASDTRMMNDQFVRSGSFLGHGHMVDSLQAPSVQYIESYEHLTPTFGVPATYPALLTGAGSYTDATHGQAQVGYSMAHMGNRTVAPQFPARRTQGGRRTTAPSDLSISDFRHSSVRRYEPYARRLSHTAAHNQVVGQGTSAGPTYSVGPYWGVTPQVGQVMQNNTSVMSDGETFPCLPQGTSHYSASHPSEIFDQPETAPIQSSSWSVPPLHTSAASQLSATVHGEWSPTDEDLQARQNMMDYAYYNGGPSTSRRM